MSKLTDTIAAAIKMMQDANVQIGALQAEADNAIARATNLAAENLILTQRIKALQSEVDTLRKAPPPRKLTKLTAPVREDVDWSDVDIDASGVSRVFDINDGKIKRIKLRNVRITGATSIIEGWANGLTVECDACEFERVKRYGVYIESKDASKNKSNPTPILDRIANRVTLRNCRFGPSVHETPLRLMYGVAADIADCEFINDNKDKANIALRLHCHTMTLQRVRSTGTKLGHAEWPAAAIKCVDVDFSGGHFAMEGCQTRPVYVNCKFAA